ncbi:ATP-binding protein [Streptomyces iconiensis]|uniref:ATP-binding protein n=1 Tax=Streptomyces iconiensis TaxID=1384038 RepID=A0ABT7A6I9_9ACTN|nr:ATP-binding protein [Streptomyces iconiensis]MDJ1136936.1 ATP-binding protein [Streptomyces iconiensis]
MNSEAQPPLFREVFYRRERESVPKARAFVRWALADWGVDGRGDDVLLCVGELATNALLHGVPPGRGFRLHLFLYADEGDEGAGGGEGVLRVEVHDSGGGEVRSPSPCPEAEGGRGLLLVAGVADKWGVGERSPGKVVWCEFAVRLREVPLGAGPLGRDGIVNAVGGGKADEDYAV